MTHQQNQKKVWDRLRPVKSHDFLEQMKEILQKTSAASAKIEKQLKMADVHNQWPFQDPIVFPQNMAWKMVQYLHFRILKFPFPWRLGWLEIDPVEIDLVTDASVVNKNGDVTVVQHVSDALTQQYLQDAPLKHMCFETFNCRCIHHKSSSCCSCKPTEMYHKSNVNPNFSG